MAPRKPSDPTFASQVEQALPVSYTHLTLPTIGAV